MKIINNQIKLTELKILAQNTFGDLVKAVVDIEKEIMAIDGELHADEERLLLEHGCEQKNLWGINIYPEMSGKDLIEFDSMINIRPSQGNRTRGIDDIKIQDKIFKITDKLIKK